MNDGRKYINPEVNADNVRFLDFAKDNNQSRNSQVSNETAGSPDFDDKDVPF